MPRKQQAPPKRPPSKPAPKPKPPPKPKPGPPKRPRPQPLSKAKPKLLVKIKARPKPAHPPHQGQGPIAVVATHPKSKPAPKSKSKARPSPKHTARAAAQQRQHKQAQHRQHKQTKHKQAQHKATQHHRKVVHAASGVKPGAWVTVGATWYARSSGGGACGNLNDGGLHFAELGTATRAGRATGRGWLARALGVPGELPCGYGLYVKYNGRTTYATKADRGYGQGGNGVTSDSHYAIDLYYSLANYLHFDGKANVEVSIPVEAGVQIPGGVKPPPSKQRYYNPLMAADVTPERIDQGVDYGVRSGYLVAIADGVVGHVDQSGFGWPGGYVVYEITQPGPLHGVFIYGAEGVSPVVKEGEHVRGGARIANLRAGWPTGIELGYAADNTSGESWARAHGGWTTADDSASRATRAGIAFSELIKSLHGPPGIIRGEQIGQWPPWVAGSLQAAKSGVGTVPSPIPPNVLNTRSAGTIITQDDYSGTIRSVWSGLDKGFHDHWQTAKATHDRLGKITFIPARKVYHK